MSWELASFLIVVAVVLGGFAWYERSRPPSQVVALVAALAALAIAGRIAFAAFPNVKPTTDIVIFAGYALGAAPGLRRRRPRRAGLQLLVRPGPVDAVADGGLGVVRGLRRGAGAGRAQRRPPDPGRRLRLRRHRLRRSAQLLPDGDLRRRPLARALPRPGGARDPLRRRPRDRQRRPRADRRPGDDPDADPLPRAVRVGEERAGSRAARPCARRRGRDAAPRPRPGDRRSRPGRGLRRRPRHRLAALGPERRRRLGLLARRRLERLDDRLGDARAGGRRPQPARRIPQRQHPGRLPAPQRRARSAAPATSPARSSPWRAPASTPAPSAAATSSPTLLKRRRDNGSFEGWPGTTAFASSPCARPAPPAASTRRSPGWPRSRTTTAAGATSPARPAPPTAPAP